MEITIFKDSNTRETVVEFSKVVQAIRTGKHLDKFFAPSGVITVSGRKKNTLIYSKLVLLSFGANSDMELGSLFQKIIEMSTTYCCFRNHDDNGLNVLVKTDCWDGHHKTGYKQVVEAYKDYLGIEVSNHQPDEHILCQLSHDPNIKYNFESRTFKVDINTKKQVVTEEELYELQKNEFEEQVKRTEQHTKLSDKTWNSYYGILASNCSEAGIPITPTLEFIKRSSNLNKAIIGIVRRVYRISTMKKKRPNEIVFSFKFKNFLNYHDEVEFDEILFFEYLLYKSITLGIPFYCADKKVKAELRIKRHRLNVIVSKFKSMGFLCTFKKDVNEDDKFQTTYYQLILSKLQEAAQDLMIDPSYFLKTLMPLLIQKDNKPTGYSPSS
jgi:hypothetical protein